MNNSNSAKDSLNTNKLVFLTLYIFSSSEKKAKVVSFSDGKNMISSNASDGSDRGKSIIMKSLYHTLGADCNFDDMWDDSSKTYIVKFSVNQNVYYIYRNQGLFKIFDSNLNRLAMVVNRQELAAYLNKLFNFAVQLPSRDEEQLEITPPAYNYILNFLDQDELSGTHFSSFKNLGQYPNYKENMLYYHFGVFDEKYYNLIKQLDNLKEQNQELLERQTLSDKMLNKIVSNIGTVSYTKNIDLLREDVEKSKLEYSNISKTLSNIRNKLIELRNEKEELLVSLKSLDTLYKSNEKQLDALNNHICPFCNSKIEDTLDLRISKYSNSSDIILLSNDMQLSIGTIERKIKKQEVLYEEWLLKLKNYENSFGEKSAEINDILKHRGFIEVRDNLISELALIKKEIDDNISIEKVLKKEERQYAKIKKEINENYYKFMLQDKNHFGLQEIKAKSIEKITKNYTARGSNKPIATVIWYMNLINLKNKFNPSAIKFPIVFDSPNNAEMDFDKKMQVYKYLVDRADKNTQLILSGIGYNSKDFNNIDFDKVIMLNNNKYELLSYKDYEENVDFLTLLCQK